MSVLKPLRAALFFYEVVRLLLLFVFLFIAVTYGFFAGSSGGGVLFPYLVYLSANTLFVLMALFVWLNPEEYRNYLPLYIAGKIIAVVSFYVWEFFSSREFSGTGDLVKSVVLLGGSAFISLADILSVWGAWTLKNKITKSSPSDLLPAPGADGGSRQASENSLESGGM